jgi:hypothetical protein
VSCLFKTAHRTTRALFAEGRAIEIPAFSFIARYFRPLADCFSCFRETVEESFRDADFPG